jgi:hypothetical protein
MVTASTSRLFFRNHGTIHDAAALVGSVPHALCATHQLTKTSTVIKLLPLTPISRTPHMFASTCRQAAAAAAVAAMVQPHKRHNQLPDKGNLIYCQAFRLQTAPWHSETLPSQGSSQAGSREGPNRTAADTATCSKAATMPSDAC